MFFTASLSLFKSIGAGTDLSISNLSTLHFKFFKFYLVHFSTDQYIMYHISN